MNLFELASVICPSCCQSFEVVSPAPDELPCEMDYDCEICCHPMIIRVFVDADGAVAAEAHGLSE